MNDLLFCILNGLIFNYLNMEKQYVSIMKCEFFLLLVLKYICGFKSIWIAFYTSKSHKPETQLNFKTCEDDEKGNVVKIYKNTFNFLVDWTRPFIITRILYRDYNLINFSSWNFYENSPLLGMDLLYSHWVSRILFASFYKLRCIKIASLLLNQNNF